jgi:hypothetical protein
LRASPAKPHLRKRITQRWSSPVSNPVLSLVLPASRRPAPLTVPATLEHHSGFSETTYCSGSLLHFRNDFGCWNFLSLKSNLNLTSILPMQTCRNQKCRAYQDAKNSTGDRCATIVFFRDNQEA